MTENMKRFLEAISANRELADKEELIAIAKGLGFELSDGDFVKPDAQNLSDDELGVVAGGGVCVCAVGGGGEAAGRDAVCACVAVGGGANFDHGERCVCMLGGGGKSMSD